MQQPDTCKESKGDHRNSYDGKCIEQFGVIGARFDIVALSCYASRVTDLTFEIATSVIRLMVDLIFERNFRV